LKGEKMKYVVTVNGKKFEVEVEKVGGASRTLSRQPAERTVRQEAVVETKAAPVVETPVSAPAATSSVAGGTTITSPMPGSILDVKVNVGDKVKYGQTLAILEAMKMENDIPATVDGEVAEIKVKKGDIVESDAVLIVIK
jgi:acetyl-coA carboxylase, biotin carboxyl carrier protein